MPFGVLGAPQLADFRGQLGAILGATGRTRKGVAPRCRSPMPPRATPNTNTPHIMPLASQAVAILRDLKPLTGRGRYVFWSGRSSQRPMSDNAILAAMRRIGIAKDEMSCHGFRAWRAPSWTRCWGFGRISSSNSSRTRCAIRMDAPTTARRTGRSAGK
jgi:integrase